MEENKIRIKRNEGDLYRINISDDGEEIVFDLTDIGLFMRAEKAFKEVKSNENRANQRIKAIDNKYVNQPMNEKLEEQRRSELVKIYGDMFAENRRIMNDFFGNPKAMDCLFGDANYFEMYNDLFEQLEPHFERMKLSVEGIKNRLEAKYGSTNNVIK